MKSIHVVFVLLLVIAGITAFVFTADQPVGATGQAHATMPGLSVGGERGTQISAIGDAPYYFQISVILLAGALLYMGIPARRRDGLLKAFFVFGLGFALFAWTMVYTGYEAYLSSGEAAIVFGFPVPTTWMLWGIWGSFVVFDLFYVVAFRRYFLPKEDEQAFDALVREIKAEQERA